MFEVVGRDIGDHGDRSLVGVADPEVVGVDPHPDRVTVAVEQPVDAGVANRFVGRRDLLLQELPSCIIHEVPHVAAKHLLGIPSEHRGHGLTDEGGGELAVDDPYALGSHLDHLAVQLGPVVHPLLVVRLAGSVPHVQHHDAAVIGDGVAHQFHGPPVAAAVPDSQAYRLPAAGSGDRLHQGGHGRCGILWVYEFEGGPANPRLCVESERFARGVGRCHDHACAVEHDRGVDARSEQRPGLGRGQRCSRISHGHLSATTRGDEDGSPIRRDAGFPQNALTARQLPRRQTHSL